MKGPNTIAYLGPEGTFSQVAAIKHFGKSSEFQSCSTIEDVFALVENEQARYGIVPIENSTEGTVNNAQDCLLETKVLISGEVIVAIEHHLLAAKSTEIDALKIIASHKQSLAQCRTWLSNNCLLYTSPSPRDATLSRMPSSA